MALSIQKGNRENLSDLLRLIKELAVYERAENEVEVTLEELEQDGFGPKKVFDFFVALEQHEVVGIALYYTKYSTWKGKCIYLEDIVVTQSCRQKGIGSMLFEAVVREAKKMKAKRMEWQVLEWNKPALNFYKKYKANLDPEWVNGKLVYNQIQQF